MAKKDKTVLERIGEVVHDLGAGLLNAGPSRKPVGPTTRKKSAKKSLDQCLRKLSACNTKKWFAKAKS